RMLPPGSQHIPVFPIDLGNIKPTGYVIVRRRLQSLAEGVFKGEQFQLPGFTLGNVLHKNLLMGYRRADRETSGSRRDRASFAPGDPTLSAGTIRRRPPPKNG